MDAEEISYEVFFQRWLEDPDNHGMTEDAFDKYLDRQAAAGNDPGESFCCD